MIAVTAIVSTGLFVLAFGILGIARIGAGVLVTARDAVAVMRDENSDDETREKVARRASLQLMGALFSILVRTALAVLAAFVPIWIAASAGFAASGDVLRFLSRWDVIVAASLVIIAGYIMWMRMRSFT